MRLLHHAARGLRLGGLAFLVFFALPLAANALVQWRRDAPDRWDRADWSSSGLLPAAAHKPAIVRIYAARTGRWKGVFAVHTWIVLKTREGPYERYDKVGWGQPVRRNNWAPDGRWYSNDPQTVFAADGEAAEALIPALRAGVAAYRYSKPGDYRAWPGPNSNTFVSCVIADAVAHGARMPVALPPNALGKDYPCHGEWLSRLPGGGVRLTLRGFGGLNLGWIEGVELNVLGAIAGLDWRRPALKIPGVGRVGATAL